MNKDTQKEIDETINNLKMILKPLTDYDDVLKIMNNERGTMNGYSVNVNEFYDDEYGDKKSTGFDLDFGLMGFTIYRTENNGFRLCENASYYDYDEEDDYTEIIDIKIKD